MKGEMGSAGEPGLPGPRGGPGPPGPPGGIGETGEVQSLPVSIEIGHHQVSKVKCKPDKPRIREDA